MQRGDYYTHHAAKFANVIPLYIRVALLYSAIFVPAVTFFFHNRTLQVVNYIDAAIITWAYFYFKRTKRVEPVSLAFCLMAYMTVVAGIVTNGVYQSGFYLAFPYLPFVGFIRSPKSTLRWMVGLFITMACLLLAEQYQWLNLAVSVQSFAFYLVMYVITALLIYAYILENEASDQMVHRKIKDVERANDQLQDALEELEAEKQLAKSTIAKDEAILSSVGDGLIAFGPTGRVELVNQNAERLLGYSQAELLKSEYTKLVKATTEEGEPIAVKDRPVNRALHDKQTTSTTLMHRRKDGSLLPAHITVAPVILGGKVVGAIEVFRDVSRELEIDKAKTEFVSLASHQLRTPLSTISWYTEMLLAGDAGKMSEEQKKYLDEIYRGNRRMIELVGSLLNVSRVDLGTFSVDPEPTDLIKLTQDIVRDLEPRIFSRKLNFQEHYPKKLPKLNVDPKLIRMVIENLASNAVKYTPERGSVELIIAEGKGSLQITVKDTGYGIPKAQQAKVFAKLFRADNVKAQNTEGTGLGLYLAKSIVSYAGGKIWFESTEGKGTTFYVELPMSGMKAKHGKAKLGS